MSPYCLQTSAAQKWRWLSILLVIVVSPATAFAGGGKIELILSGDFSPVPDDENVIDVYGDLPPSCALRDDGSVFWWGGGRYQDLDMPAAVALQHKQFGFFGALHADGSVRTWFAPTGFGIQGAALKLPNDLGPVVGVDYDGRGAGIGLKADGSVVTWIDPGHSLISLYGVADQPVMTGPFVDVACAGGRYFAVHHDGRLLTWDALAFDQKLTLPQTLNDAIDVAAHSSAQIYAVREGGKAWAVPSQEFSRNFPSSTTTAARIQYGEGWTMIHRDGTVTGGGIAFDYLETPQQQARLEGNDWLTLQPAVGALIGIKAPDTMATAWALPQVHEATAGETVVFKAYVYGKRPWTLQWYKNGEPIEGANGETFVLENVDATDAGSYVLSVENPNGTIESTASQINVAKQAQTISFTAIDDMPFSATEPVPLSAAASSGLPVSFEVVGGPAVLAESGNAVMLEKPGLVTVRAMQEGDLTFLPAEPAEQTFRSGYTLTFTAGGNGTGTVNVEPNFPLYEPGQAVTVSALPVPDSFFLEWQGDVQGVENPAMLVMEDHRTVTAVFQRHWTLTIEDTMGGRVEISPDKALYADGETVDLTAIPLDGFAFSEWEGIGGADDPMTSINVTGNLTIKPIFVDVAPPEVAILSPAGGVTNLGTANLVAQISDNAALATVRWTFGSDATDVDLEQLGDTLAVTDLPLALGENRFTVEAVDSTGLTTLHEVFVTWQPNQLLNLGQVGRVFEGKLFNVPLTLDSLGTVAGTTLVLRYDATFLTEAALLAGEALEQASLQINTEMPGEIRLSVAQAASVFPEGSVLLGEFQFRARSVPEDLSTNLTLDVIDIVDSDTQDLLSSTGKIPSLVSIQQRMLVGDANTNDRLDIGDAIVMQRMLAGFLEVRDWDHALNDLSGNGNLDSGDAIVALREAAVIADVPAVQAQDDGSADADEPDLVLVGDRANPRGGEEVTVAIHLREGHANLSGAALTFHYPVNAFRLESPSSHQLGSLIPAGSLSLWNLSPEGDDYASQDGRIRLVVSSPRAWAGAEAGGVLAQLKFTAVGDPGVFAAGAFEITDAELARSNGYDLISLTGERLFVGPPSTYSLWQMTHFEAGATDSANPLDDVNGDGSANLLAYHAGRSPIESLAKAEPRFVWVDEAGEPYPALIFERSIHASDVQGVVEISDDLVEWRSNRASDDESISVLHEVRPSEREGVEVVVVRSAMPYRAGGPQWLRLSVTLVEMPGALPE